MTSLPDLDELLGGALGQQDHLQVLLPQLAKVGQLEPVGLLHRQGVLAGQGHQPGDWLEGDEWRGTARGLRYAVQHLQWRPSDDMI